jgi:hypothetical protein
MSKLTKHVGRINNTNRRCIVVFRELPDDPESALIVDTDGLQERVHENLITVVNSREAQATNNFYEVLNRRSFFDGGNMLQALHQRGLLRKVAVDLVTLYPMPNRPLALRTVNEMIKGGNNIPEEGPAQPASSQPQEQAQPTEQAQPPMDDTEATAYNMLKQAELLEADALNKREEAYKLNPKLKPAPVKEEAKEEKPKPKRTTRKKKEPVEAV